MIDIHAHFFPSTILEEVPERASGLGVSYSGEGTLIFPSGPSRPIPAPLTDLDARRGVIGRLGVTRQVLSPWLDVAGDDLAGAQATAWAALYNDGMAREVGDDRVFSLFATLPVTDGDAAAAELARTVTELGFAGGTLPTQVGGRNLNDSGLDPLFEAAEALDVPLFLHPFRVLGEDRMRRDFLTNLCGNPFEVTLAAVTLFLAGIPERYPRLRILLAHCGGALAIVAGRVARGSQRVPAVRRRLEAPDDILGCYYYDTLVHDPAALAFCLERIGPDRCAAGSDIPFPMDIDDPAAHIREALGSVGLASAWPRVAEGTALEILPSTD